MAKRIRPLSIRLFELSVCLGLAIGVAASLLAYREVPDEATWPEMTLVIALTIGLSLLLVWLIAWRASNVTRWIFVALTVLGIAFYVIDLVYNPQPSALVVTLTAIVYLLSVIEIVLLFRRDARDWFAGRPQVDADIFT